MPQQKKGSRENNTRKGKRSFSKRELANSTNPLLHKASRMILYKTGGRREVNISIFFQAGKKIHWEQKDEKEQSIFDDNEREYQD